VPYRLPAQNGRVVFSKTFTEKPIPLRKPKRNCVTYLNNNMPRVKYMTVQFECVGCHQHVDLEVEVESLSDYYFEDSCPHCGAALPFEITQSIPDRVVDHFVGEAEYLEDR
jgi:hypothetical protein